MVQDAEVKTRSAMGCYSFQYRYLLCKRVKHSLLYMNITRGICRVFLSGVKWDGSNPSGPMTSSRRAPPSLASQRSLIRASPSCHRGLDVSERPSWPRITWMSWILTPMKAANMRTLKKVLFCTSKPSDWEICLSLGFEASTSCSKL